MKGFGLRGQSPPFSLNVTKETSFYRSAPLNIDEALIKEATDILFPNSSCVSIHEAPTVKGLLTMEGKIVQVRDKH